MANVMLQDFGETVIARIQRDPKFQQAMFAEAINACLSGDTSSR